MPDVIVIGGGLAGLSAAAALAGAGFRVDLYESRACLGGRASSFVLNSERIDNCQHVLLGCCVNLRDFYRRLGVADRIRYFREFHFIEPGGRVSVLRSPASLFLRLRFLNAAERISLIRGLAALRREHGRRADLDSITMLDWLREKRQPERAIRRFWGQVLVSAINEDLDRIAARYGFQFFRLGFFAGKEARALGVPAVLLSELYAPERWARFPELTTHLRSPVERIETEGGRARGVIVNGERRTADFYISAVPFERIASLAPELGLDLSAFQHSPITGVHLWFDRQVMDLPQAALLDRTIQWAFNKRDGQYVQVVISASRGLLEMPRTDVIALAVRELAEFFPRAAGARLEKAHVVKEARATFSPRPGLEAFRPPARTRFENLFLAGDWTRNGWPPTMEAAVRSGYLAAEAVTRAAGRPQSFLVADAAR